MAAVMAYVLWLIGIFLISGVCGYVIATVFFKKPIAECQLCGRELNHIKQYCKTCIGI